MNNTKFERALKEIKDIEGGYSNHPMDTGGKTKFGITERLARAHGYKGDMKNLTWGEAKEIYKGEYWLPNHYGKIESYKIAREVFEQAINLPYIKVKNRMVLKANYHLQKSYNYTSENEILVDGLVGPKTIKAINNCENKKLLYKFLNGFQAKHYLELADKNDRYLAFIKGWFAKRVDF